MDYSISESILLIFQAFQVGEVPGFRVQGLGFRV